jgi:hypothetical protein
MRTFFDRSASAPRRIDKPEPGYWLVKAVKRGPLIPAAILWLDTRSEPGNPDNLMERSPHLCGFLAGEPVSPWSIWERRGIPIDEARYRFEVADGAWAKEHAPQEPKANPRQPIDLTALPPLYRSKKHGR